jgi:L-rhamnose mutarotase
MTQRRMLSLARLRPECVQEYVRLHQQVWPELLAIYRQAGIRHVSCFLNGLDLVVYTSMSLTFMKTHKDL